MLKDVTETMIKEVKQSMMTISHQIENINTDNFFKKKLNSGVEKYKNETESSLETLNSRFQRAEKRICKLEVISTERLCNPKNKEKTRMKKNEQRT